MGLYYKIIDCSTVPTCDESTFIAGLGMHSDTMDPVLKSYSYSFSLDATALSCIVLEPQ